MTTTTNTLTSKDPADHLRAGHTVAAQWTIWYSHTTHLDDDGAVMVDTMSGKSLDDSDGDTEFYCQDCLTPLNDPEVFDYV